MNFLDLLGFSGLLDLKIFEIAKPTLGVFLGKNESYDMIHS